MKRIAIFVVALIACSTMVGFVAYSIGYQRRAALAQTIRYGDTIVLHQALTNLRSGHIEKGIYIVDTLYLRDDDMIYSDPSFQRRFVGHTNAAYSDEVRSYLNTYHTNRTKWTPVIKDLRKNLEEWR